jgi:hypothetical protein
MKSRLSISFVVFRDLIDSAVEQMDNGPSMLQANEVKDYPNDDRKDHGPNDYLPCRQLLPSRQWKSDEWFHPSVQETNF